MKSLILTLAIALLTAITQTSDAKAQVVSAANFGMANDNVNWVIGWTPQFGNVLYAQSHRTLACKGAKLNTTRWEIQGSTGRDFIYTVRAGETKYHCGYVMETPRVGQTNRFLINSGAGNDEIQARNFEDVNPGAGNDLVLSWGANIQAYDAGSDILLIAGRHYGAKLDPGGNPYGPVWHRAAINGGYGNDLICNHAFVDVLMSPQINPGGGYDAYWAQSGATTPVFVTMPESMPATSNCTERLNWAITIPNRF